MKSQESKSKAEIKKEIDRLRADIELHNKLYFVDDKPKISDA